MVTTLRHYQQDVFAAVAQSVARRKGLTFMLVRRMKHTYPPSIRLVEKGLVDVRSLVTHCFPLEQGSHAFKLALERQGLKIILKP